MNREPKMKIRAISIVSIFCAALIPVMAQESEDQTVTELYLQSQIKVQVIRAEAADPERDMKLIALDDIESLLQDDPGNAEVLGVLKELGGEGVTNVVREQGHVINNFPDVRSRAAEILGRQGSPEAAGELATMLLTDPEPMVMSSAIQAIAEIELEDNEARGKRDRAMAASIYRQTAVNKDNTFAYRFLEAVEIIVEREGRLSDPMILEEVAKIANARNGYNRAVRERAYTLLRALSGTSGKS